MIRPKVPSMSSESRRETTSLIDVIDEPAKVLAETILKRQLETEIEKSRIPLFVACREYLRKIKLNSRVEDIDFVRTLLKASIQKKGVPPQIAEREAQKILDLVMAYFIEQTKTLGTSQTGVERTPDATREIQGEVRGKIRDTSERG